MTTLADVRKMVAGEEAELARLRARREELAGEMAAVAQSIASLRGVGKAAEAAQEEAPVKPVVKGRKRRKAGKKTTLKGAVAAVLTQADGSMRAPEIVAELGAVGYESASKDPTKRVSTLLGQSKEFRKVSRGLYTIARSGKGQTDRTTGRKAGGKALTAAVAQSISLSDAIMQVLGKSRKGMAAEEIAVGVAKTGYDFGKGRPATIVSMALGRMKGQVGKMGKGGFRLMK